MKIVDVIRDNRKKGIKLKRKVTSYRYKRRNGKLYVIRIWEFRWGPSPRMIVHTEGLAMLYDIPTETMPLLSLPGREMVRNGGTGSNQRELLGVIQVTTTDKELAAELRKNNEPFQYLIKPNGN